jgi:hypothetical protein
VLSSIVLDSEGRLQHTTLRGKTSCAHLKAADFQKVEAALNEPGLAVAVQDATRRGAAYADYEEIDISTDAWEGAVPLELVPPELESLMGTLGNILREYLGKTPPWESR